jgi:MFS family permease
MSTTHVDTRNEHDDDRGGVALPARGARTFAIVSVGQFIALTGVTVLNFAVAYYVYGNYPLLIVGFVYAFPFVAFLMASLVSGSLIDRWGPRRALLVTNVAGIALAATVGVVVPFTHTVNQWHGFVVVMLIPMVKAMQLPAFEASVPLLVPKRHIGRANGTRMFFNGFGAVMAPLIALVLLHSIGIGGVVVLAILCEGLGILTTYRLDIPRVRQDNAAPASLRVLLGEAMDAWRHMRAKDGLRALLAFFGVVSAGIGFVEVLIPRLVEGFASDDTLQVVLGIGVVGMAAFGVAMTITGGPRPRVRGTLLYTLLFAAAMVVGSVRANVILVAVAAFVFLGTTSIILGNVHTILHIKMEPSMMGRVMALKNVVYAGLLMVGDITAGVSSGIFEPLIGKDHIRSRVVATLVGGGGGRAFAVLMMAGGVVIAVCVFFAHRYPRLRRLDEVLPDVTPEDLTAEKETAPDTARR